MTSLCQSERLLFWDWWQLARKANTDGRLRSNYAVPRSFPLTILHPERQAISGPPHRQMIRTLLLAETESEKPSWALLYHAWLRAGIQYRGTLYWKLTDLVKSYIFHLRFFSCLFMLGSGMLASKLVSPSGRQKDGLQRWPHSNPWNFPWQRDLQR